MQISSINKFCHFDKTRQIFVLSRRDDKLVNHTDKYD